MKRKNMISMVTSLALVGVVAVGGTLALLSTTSNNVTNTFTVGTGYKNQDLVLNEAPVTKDTTTGNVGGYIETMGDRVMENTYADLVAGTTLAKDPQFTIADDCAVKFSWVVAKITGFNEKTDASQLAFSGIDSTEDYSWWHVTKDGEEYKFTEVTSENYTTELVNNGVYIYEKALEPGEKTTDLFQQLSVTSVVAGKDISQMVINGWAVEGVYTTQTVEGEDVDTAVAFGTVRKDVMDQLNLFS